MNSVMGQAVTEGPDRPTAHEIYERLRGLPEFAQLREYDATVAFLFLRDPVFNNGKQVLGRCCLPRVQGTLFSVFVWALEKALGFMPTYIVLLDYDFWCAATDMEREILLYHEMKHQGIAVDKEGELRFNPEDGTPIWGITPHDVEEFEELVARYGPHTADLERFRDTLVKHSRGKTRE